MSHLGNSPKPHPTRAQAFTFFQRTFSAQPDAYLDSAHCLLSTQLAEEAQAHFGVLTEQGDSPVESELFDWATEFALQQEKRLGLNT